MLVTEQVLQRAHWRAGVGRCVSEQWGTKTGRGNREDYGGDGIVQSFSNFPMHKNHGEGLLKYRLLGPTPRVSD